MKNFTMNIHSWNKFFGSRVCVNLQPSKNSSKKPFYTAFASIRSGEKAAKRQEYGIGMQQDF